MEIIISAIISAISTILVCIISTNANHKKYMKNLEKSEILQTYRLEQLEKQYDRNEKIIDRFFTLEKDMDITAEKIKNTDYRIKTLEQNSKNSSL